MMNQAEILFGKLAGEFLLGRIRLYPNQEEPSYIHPLRTLLQQVKKTFGEATFNSFTEDFRPAAHAFADLLFDKITETDLPKTKAALMALPLQIRVMVEQGVNSLTGKTFSSSSRSSERHHWHSELWQMRKMVRFMVDSSVTGVTLQEIREGFDPFVHSLVDQLWDNQKMLVN